MESTTIRRSFLVILTVLVVIAGGSIAINQANAASSTPVVYVATGENFPDALGAASAAAVQGGPVLLVLRDSIPQVTKDELTRLAPDRIIVAGGTAVVSQAVFNALGAYAPTVERAAGPDRYATAVEVSQSAFPATTGGADLTALVATVDALSVRVHDLEAENDAQAAEIAALQALLAGVSRDGSTLLLDSMNLQVVSGAGITNGPPNGLGNIIIGYNEDPISPPMNHRGGSHNLVLGAAHTYTGNAYSGIVAGFSNTIAGGYSSVLGGYNNAAIGYTTTVLGGSGNTAEGNYSSATGGRSNDVTGAYDVVIGGDNVLCDISATGVCGEGTISLLDI